MFKAVDTNLPNGFRVFTEVDKE